ncbi:hypothetical protein V5T82_05385 [Magnetovibrio sp. PR-2]|uniref:hypothetical protein n=1 Tax=Magnetovibrio sp. PR-2 TaxID=3120356 RepID=UPI002FCE13EC
MRVVTARIVQLITVLSLFFGQGAWAQGVQLSEVFIDARQPAYVTYQALSLKTPPLARQEMLGYANLDGVTLVKWDLFRDNVDKFIASGIRINEYSKNKTALSILTMLKTKPGRPVSITWNGGIATSFFDFQLAVESFEAFQENPVQYEIDRDAGEFGNNLDPAVQLRTMLDREQASPF